ncbi:patatin [Reticulibacter mediterranei]|uniref:Patatin n=1 Tax=Reticulibacter mediterranei TaxID=2778369 RepID=A0A8J3N4X8_9CHLR|nr:patatin-like phospholipase family protein [Reticulibacter mediterranei]GHO94547.1 patatin [Reticulibacter mediterranei]
MTETKQQQTKALVLGGGGSTGNAWEIGLLLGLHDEGVDLSDAALVVGTSAGSTVGVQLASDIELEEFYILQGTLQEQEKGQFVPPLDSTVLLRMMAPGRGAPDAQTALVRVLAVALAAKTISEEERLKSIVRRLRVQQWPERQHLVITAVNAQTGELVQFTRDSGIPLEVAIAASSAVPGVYPPTTIGNSRYVDAGVRSGTNADIATGYRRVLILRAETAFDVSALNPQEAIPVITFDDELAELQRSGSQVMVITPDEASAIARGPNMLDVSRRTISAEAGRRQGRSLAERVKSFWRALE